MYTSEDYPKNVDALPIFRRRAWAAAMHESQQSSLSRLSSWTAPDPPPQPTQKVLLCMPWSLDTNLTNPWPRSLFAGTAPLQRLFLLSWRHNHVCVCSCTRWSKPLIFWCKTGIMRSLTSLRESCCCRRSIPSCCWGMFLHAGSAIQCAPKPWTCTPRLGQPLPPLYLPSCLISGEFFFRAFVNLAWIRPLVCSALMSRPSFLWWPNGWPIPIILELPLPNLWQWQCSKQLVT